MSIVDNYTVSYAQNREDVIIAGFFPDVTNGTYVDVGANHPEDDSVTKYFYDRGWHGINVEPNRKLLELLKSRRPEDINLGVGVADKPGKITFREYANHGLSTFAPEIMHEYEKSHSEKTDTFKEYEVPVTTLRDIFKENKVGIIHFLKVDVEGYEYEVLKGNDWQQYRPELICIETNHLIKDPRPVLKEVGYQLAFYDGLNEYYLAKEKAARAKKFDYAETLLLDKPVITIHVANQLRVLEDAARKYEALETGYASLRNELAKLERDYTEAIEQRNKLFTMLEQYSTLRKLVRSLAVHLHKRILTSIEKLRQPTRVLHARPLPLSQFEDKSTEELLEIAGAYDTRNFRHPSPYTSPRYILYILASRTYKLVIRGVKKAIRLLRRIKKAAR